MEITRVIWNQDNQDPLEVEHIDFLTEDFAACNLERAPDRTILKGRFGESYLLQFWAGDLEVPFEEIISLSFFMFKGAEVRIGRKESRATLKQWEEIVNSLPNNNLDLN